MKWEDFPDSLRAKIEVIQNEKRYAVEELGLNVTDNYTTFYDQKGETALWNVSACRAYSFDPKIWWFPIVGDVPYKGFFDFEKASGVGSELREEGWDVRIRGVSGWSTLGWFKDPILSEMLNRSEGQLAELIIHELTHGTIFVKDRVTFREPLIINFLTLPL
ncbi:MAG: aminopeptidase, partial [Cytophagales bacterium]|nr:aminopeptidase [Cytophagales bacterium]